MTKAFDDRDFEFDVVLSYASDATGQRSSHGTSDEVQVVLTFLKRHHLSTYDYRKDHDAVTLSNEARRMHHYYGGARYCIVILSKRYVDQLGIASSKIRLEYDVIQARRRVTPDYMLVYNPYELALPRELEASAPYYISKDLISTSPHKLPEEIAWLASKVKDHWRRRRRQKQLDMALAILNWPFIKRWPLLLSGVVALVIWTWLRIWPGNEKMKLAAAAWPSSPATPISASAVSFELKNVVRSPTASSTMPSSKPQGYFVTNLFDKNMETAWCSHWSRERPLPAAGSWIKFSIDPAFVVTALRMRGGWAHYSEIAKSTPGGRAVNGDMWAKAQVATRIRIRWSPGDPPCLIDADPRCYTDLSFNRVTDREVEKSAPIPPTARDLTVEVLASDKGPLSGPVICFGEIRLFGHPRDLGSAP